MAEKEPLLGQVDIQQDVPVSDSEKEKKISWRHLVLAPILFLMFLGDGIFRYVYNEWTQTEVRDEYFSNTSVRTNISLCEIVNKSDADYATYKTVQQKSAQWLMYFRIASSISTIPASLLWPSYSDFYGRRNFLILGIVGLAIKVCGCSFVIFAQLKLYYILVLFAIQGFTNVTISVSFSYVADITFGEKQRVRGIVFLDFLLVGSSLVSSPLSGFLVQTMGLGFAYTSAICSGLVLIALFMACLFLPETLEKERRPPTQSIASTLRKLFSIYSTNEFKRNRLSFIVLLVIFMFTAISEANRTQMEVLYLLGQPFCWGPAFIGYFTLARHAAISVFGLLALYLMQKCMSNVAIAALSCLSCGGSYVVEGLARTAAMIYCVPAIGMLSFLMFPMIRGLMSNMTSPETQGSMFATLAIVEVVGDLLAVTENEIYAASLSIMNGFVFLCMAGFSMIEFVLLLLFCCIQPQKVLETEK